MKKYLISILLFLLMTPTTTWAGKAYGSLLWSWGATISSSPALNGVDGAHITGDLGYSFGYLSVEAFYRNHNFSSVFTDSRGTFDVTVLNKVYGLGLRVTLIPIFDFKVGYTLNQTRGTFSNPTGPHLISNIDGTFSGAYIGIGYKNHFHEKFDFFAEMSYHFFQENVSILGIEVGVRYYFYEF